MTHHPSPHTQEALKAKAAAERKALEKRFKGEVEEKVRERVMAFRWPSPSEPPYVCLYRYQIKPRSFKFFFFAYSHPQCL